jgi:hypothetical protein
VPEPLRPQPQFEPVTLEVDPLDQQLDDAGLFGGKQFVPKRVEPVERLVSVVFQ